MNIMRSFCRNSDFKIRYLFIRKEDPPTQDLDTCLCLFLQKKMKYYSLSRRILFILPFKFVVSPQLLILFLSSPIKGGCNSDQEKKSDYFVQPFPGLSDTLPLPLQSGTARTSSSAQN